MANYRIAFVEKHWDCDKCQKLRPDIVARGGPALDKHKADIKARRMGMGCEGTDRALITLDRFELSKCPGNFHNTAAMNLITMYRSYRDHGNLPYPGTMSDQPAKVFDFFSVFSWLDGIEAEREKRRQKVKSRA